MRCDNPIGEPFFELGEVDSSNNYAMQQVQAQMAGHGSTWFAHFQKAGKGQRGKRWITDPGQNILMSCVIEPAILSIDNQFVLNAVVALACCDFFNFYACGNSSIKWPNDIYWEHRKAGGILIENVFHGKKWKYSIIGIGLNINQTLFDRTIKNPVSLKQVTGKNFDVIVLAKELCRYLNNRWNSLYTISHKELLGEYCSHLYKINQTATFKFEGEIFTAVVNGINPDGELVIQKGSELPVTYKAIEWLLP